MATTMRAPRPAVTGGWPLVTGASPFVVIRISRHRGAARQALHAGDDPADDRHRRIDLFVRRTFAEAEADAATRRRLVVPQRAQDVRRLARASGAGGADRHGDTLEIEGGDQRFPAQ